MRSGKSLKIGRIDIKICRRGALGGGIKGPEKNTEVLYGRTPLLRESIENVPHP